MYFRSVVIFLTKEKFLNLTEKKKKKFKVICLY